MNMSPRVSREIAFFRLWKAERLGCEMQLGLFSTVKLVSSLTSPKVSPCEQKTHHRAANEPGRDEIAELHIPAHYVHPHCGT